MLFKQFLKVKVVKNIYEQNFVKDRGEELLEKEKAQAKDENDCKNTEEEAKLDRLKKNGRENFKSWKQERSRR